MAGVSVDHDTASRGFALRTQVWKSTQMLVTLVDDVRVA